MPAQQEVAELCENMLLTIIRLQALCKHAHLSMMPAPTPVLVMAPFSTLEPSMTVMTPSLSGREGNTSGTVCTHTMCSVALGSNSSLQQPARQCWFQARSCRHQHTGYMAATKTDVAVLARLCMYMMIMQPASKLVKISMLAARLADLF